MCLIFLLLHLFWYFECVDRLCVLQPPPPSTNPDELPPPPPPPVSEERSALLASIQKFNKNGLKKTVTVDKSKPFIGKGSGGSGDSGSRPPPVGARPGTLLFIPFFF
jgi:hypothetical protein